MDNKDFDKLFSDKLNAIQDFDYQEEDWENLNTQLKAYRFNFRYRNYFYSSLVVIASLLGLLGYMGYQNSYMGNSEANSAINPNPNSGSGLSHTKQIVRIDTIYNTTVVYDTIVKHATVYENITNLKQGNVKYSNYNTSPRLSSKGFEEKNTNSFFSHDTDVINNDGENVDKSLSWEYLYPLKYQGDLAMSLQEPSLSKWDMPENNSLAELEEPIIRERKKRKAYQGFQATVAYMKPHAIYKGIYDRKANGLAVEGNINGFDNFSIGLNANYMGSSFKTKTINTDLGMEELEFSYGNINYDLQNVDMKQREITFGANFKYFLSDNVKYQPYVHVGYLAGLLNNQNITYRLLDPYSNKVQLIENKYSEWLMMRNILELGVGVRYRLGYGYWLDLGTFYNYSLGQQRITRPTTIGIKAGLVFDF